MGSVESIMKRKKVKLVPKMGTVRHIQFSAIREDMQQYKEKEACEIVRINSLHTFPISSCLNMDTTEFAIWHTVSKAYARTGLESVPTITSRKELVAESCGYLCLARHSADYWGTGSIQKPGARHKATAQ